ncbi:GNAT family N-acetyltransferase [Bacteriovorax sp. PP10]|uniref:GNAT family N-acetyltransferase n=1 Tax=Bacteriovorax antarcticus TaxID=3088717 RepID=A0ABU5VQZ9_9BACT|nr:GNAT family N-acetyltransferase [Bacteriovorax sp. PP10]MEA9355483.1 GNAT family N-acetyltransferase [Bacteriovorax sp. PP10]
MNFGNNEIIDRANVSDVNEIINLYRLVYGKKYPISYGTDPVLLKKSIKNEKTHLVVVARDLNQNVITGVLITEIDSENKIGKLVGLVVHPTFQKNKIGNYLVEYVGDHFLEKGNVVNSLYATTRTNTVGPQRVFIKNQYLPLGIFPNAHRLSQYETVTLFAKFRKGLLEQRVPTKEVAPSLMPMYQILKNIVPELSIPEAAEVYVPLIPPNNDAWEFEIIRAPNYVYRKFLETFPDPKDRFFPFHTPNMLIADKEGRIEIFAYFSKRDGYCTLIKATKPIAELSGSLTSLYMQLDDIGVSYIEVLVNVNLTPSIGPLLTGQFVPSAIYPAMREVDGKFEDYIVLSRTMEPLNFRGMSVISQFKPFIDLYVDTWKQVNLDTIEVIYGSK